MLVDNFSRESLAIQVGTRLTGDDVVAALERVKAARDWAHLGRQHCEPKAA